MIAPEASPACSDPARHAGAHVPMLDVLLAVLTDAGNLLDLVFLASGARRNLHEDTVDLGELLRFTSDGTAALCRLAGISPAEWEETAHAWWEDEQRRDDSAIRRWLRLDRLDARAEAVTMRVVA